MNKAKAKKNPKIEFYSSKDLIGCLVSQPITKK